MNYESSSNRASKSKRGSRQIIAKLRQIEVLISQGHSVAGEVAGSLASRNRAITAGIRHMGVWV